MRSRTTSAVLVLAALAACKGSEGGLSATYFGKTVEPPRDLAKLRPGMTLDEARKVVPKLEEGSGRHRGDWMVDSGNAELTLVAELDDGRIDRLVVKARTTALEPILTKAWGAPTRQVDRYSKEEQPVWLNPAGGWRASLKCLERMCFLDFESHRPLTADFFGKTPVPPGAYAKARVGMAADEAAKVIGDPAAVEKYVDAGPDDVRIIAQTSSKEKRVTSVRLMLPKDSKPLLEQAWGPGLAAQDSIGKPLTVWLDEATGWRATWEGEPIGDDGSLEFTNYLPLSAIFGAGPADFALFAPAGLGATEDELSKAYPGSYLADDDALQLPPTAWGNLWTRVNVRFDDAGKATYLRFGLPYKGQALAKDQIFAAIEARFGKPTTGEDLGRPVLVYRDAAPRIVVKDDTISGEWEITYGEP